MSMSHLMLWAAASPGAAAAWDAVLNILILLTAALALGTLAERLGQSAIVGYLLAGMLVGPNSFGWIGDSQELFHIAEIGVALLLFTIGLEFSPSRLMRLGRVVVVAGPVQVTATMALAALFAFGIGSSPLEATCIGAMVALSSTACVLRLLRDRAEIDTPYGKSSLGILIVQDIAVVPLVLLVTALSSGGTALDVLWLLGRSIVLGGLLVLSLWVAFNLIAPRVLKLKSLRVDRDLPVLLAAVMAGLSAWVSNYLGLSPALGAFLAGVLLAVSPFAAQVNADIQPLKTLMVTLFFASIGLFGDPFWLVGHLHLVLGVVALIVLGKATVTYLATRLAGFAHTFGVTTGLCLAQVGEFSFVLAGIAYQPGVEDSLMSESAFRLMVSATIATMMLTPYLIAIGPRAGALFSRLITGRSGRVRDVQAETTGGSSGSETESKTDTDVAVTSEGAPHRRLLVIGFGPAAQRMVEELLSDSSIHIEVLDLNQDNLEVATRYGLTGHLGDATRSEILEHLGLSSFDVIAITLPTARVVRELIQLARALAPDARIAVRCRYHIYYFDLVQAGADVVVNEEDQVGRSLARRTRAIFRADEAVANTNDAAPLQNGAGTDPKNGDGQGGPVEPIAMGKQPSSDA